MTANMYSKCALRTVAEHVSREFDVVDYFPSFESIMLSSRDTTWKDDLIHVQDTIVALNVGRMAEFYAPSPRHAAVAASLYAA
ncbi:GSCFA family protein [compost metagenome]